jgi:ATP-binding cassette subfamily B protein
MAPRGGDVQGARSALGSPPDRRQGGAVTRAKVVGSRWWREAVTPRVLIARYLPIAGGGLVTALVLVNLVLGVLPVLFVVTTSILIGLVPDAVAGGVGSAAWSELVWAFLIAAAAFVGQQVLAPAQSALGELAKLRIDGRVQDQLMRETLRPTGVSVLEDQAALDALKAATRELESGWVTPGTACAGQLALVARYTRLAGFATLVGVVASWVAALALVVAVMVFRWGNRGGLRRYSQIWQTIMGLVRRSDYLRALSVRDTAAKELRVFGLSAWLSDRYDASYRAWLVPVWRERRRIYLYPFLAYTALGLAVAGVVLVLLARAGATGDITLTDLVIGMQATVAALLLGEHYPEADLQTQFGMLAASGLERFSALATTAEQAQGRSGSTTGASRLPQQAVRFTDLSFSYPGSDRTVLDGLDLELPAGRCTAVVGVNGAGKTTLVKLLTRLYEPTTGTVEVDGIDIRHLGVEAWRRQVSVIFQDFIRYELSAADNIAFGAVHVPRDLEAVRRAAARAGILDVFERLPHGLDTPLARGYRGGIDLSGGQWQRIAIARSLYALDAGSRVLVLDEPTAALDVRAEARFFDQFVELTRGVTSLLISHRFSSVRRADRIVVIEHGRATEQGTHDDLMAADGRYAELFRLQAERFASGPDAQSDVVDPDTLQEQLS